MSELFTIMFLLVTDLVVNCKGPMPDSLYIAETILH